MKRKFNHTRTHLFNLPRLCRGAYGHQNCSSFAALL